MHGLCVPARQRHEINPSVINETHRLLRDMEYTDLKRRFMGEDRKKLIESRCISTDADAFWLIDYWCGKDARELIQMPFSRYWIRHTEAMSRIKNKLCQAD